MDINENQKSQASILLEAGFRPGKKEGQWRRGELRIIVRAVPCCTGVVMPEPVGIPDRNPGRYDYSNYAAFDLLAGNTRVSGSVDLQEIVKAANELEAGK